MNVPISETGTASSGINVARQPWRKMIDDDDDEDQRFEERCTISLMPSRTAWVVSSDGRHSRDRPGSAAFISSISFVRRIHRLDRIGAGQLVDGDDRGGLAVHPADHVVGLRAQLDARHVLQPDHGAVRVRADHDIPEFFLRLQAALARTLYVNSCPGGTGSAPIWPAGFTVFCALMALSISVTVMPSLASWSGRTQKRIAYWPAPKICTWPMPGHARHRIVDIDVGIVGQNSVVVGAVGRIEREQRERAGRGLFDRDAEIPDFGRQLGFRLGVAHLRQNLVVVGSRRRRRNPRATSSARCWR